MSEIPPNRANLMPPIIYSSQRITDVQTQQPRSGDVINQTIQLGCEPMPMVCKSCNQNVITRVKYEIGAKAHKTSMCLSIAGYDCLACLPYCMDSTKDAHHYCPICQNYFGAHYP